ncbi:MAG: tetratricopeptide repeat-containing sensor histidine kinase [Flavobacteriaceae bacterium]|nr:ATP-binding protein [Psychroflexus sp.]
MSKFKLILFFLFWINFITAQTEALDRYFKRVHLDSIESIIFKENTLREDVAQLATANYYTVQKKLDKSFEILLSIDTLQLSEKHKAYYYHYLGKAYDHNSTYDLAVENYQKAQEKYLSIGDELRYNDLNLDLYFTMFDPTFYNVESDYLETYATYAKKLDNLNQLCNLEIEYAFNSIETDTTFQDFLIHFDKAFDYNKKDGNLFTLGILNTYKGMYFTDFVFNKDSAHYYYSKGIEINRKLGLQNKVRLAYHNLGHLERVQGNYQKAISYAKKAISQGDSDIDYDMSAYVFRLMSEDYIALNKPDSAYVYLQKSMESRDSLNAQLQNINLTRFEAEKKDKENFILTQTNARNRIVIYSTFGISAVLLILSFLYYKNFRKKQLIKQQKAQLKINETEKMLKEQELRAIDALLEGQEQERKQIAVDLHDNIGANLASISAYFEVLKQKMSARADAHVFDKTYELLKSTYKDIRGLSHYKNSAIIADKVFVVALSDLGQKLEDLHQIQFKMHSFNARQKIPQHIEVALFRIMQELLANIVKHAKAQQVEVYVNFYDDNLNIIVEDDGIGFDPSQLKQGGMGLSSIKERLMNLGGEMQIDSRIDRGTTIILDINL